MAEKNNSTPKGGITKKEAVRQALGKLGKDASRPGIQKFVKDTYGLQMTLDHISNCKGELKRKKRPSKTVVTKQSVASDQEPKKPASAPARESESNGISLEDIEAVKDLVERVGAGSLRKLIDVMAR
jgi:hypothetical protein